MAARHQFQSLRISLLTFSSRYSVDDDPRGAEVTAALREAGHRIGEVQVGFGGEESMRKLLSALLTGPADAVIGIGGTGVMDPMPEAARPLIDREVPGFAQMFQALSLRDVGSSGMLSRALAGMAGGKLLFLIPGSSGGCRLALQALVLPQLDCTTEPCSLAGLLPVVAGGAS